MRLDPTPSPFPARCDRRCEATTAVEPQLYPLLGFYCALHGYQKPRPAPGGAIIVDPATEPHLRSRTSFVSPEHSVAAEMAKSPGLVRSGSAAGSAIGLWLQERRALPTAEARAYAARMLELAILVPASPGAAAAAPSFSDAKDALYKIVPRLGGASAGATNSAR